MVVILVIIRPRAIAAPQDPTQTLRAAASVLSQIMAEPEQRIPEELLERARCIIIVPNLAVGPFAVTNLRPLGFVSCRRQSSTRWSAPAALRLESGRVGFKVGGATTDLILLVMNRGVIDALMDRKFSLGVEGSVAPGPTGRELRWTAWQATADILVWGRSDARLSGVELEGATLHEDVESNQRIYHKRLRNRAILSRGVEPSLDGRALLDLLSRYGVKLRTRLHPHPVAPSLHRIEAAERAGVPSLRSVTRGTGQRLEGRLGIALAGEHRVGGAPSPAIRVGPR